MSINWGDVEKKALQDVSCIVGRAWNNVSVGASTQLCALIAAGKRIETNKDTMLKVEYDNLRLMQQRAMEGVLQAYEGIGIDVAEQAASAAWQSVITALKTAYPLLGFL